MCDADAPPPPPPPREPEMLVNPFDDLDNEERAAQASRRGTSSLRVPPLTGLAIGFSGRGGSSSPTKASPTSSTGLAIGGVTGGAPRSAGYTPFASTDGLGHRAQQNQKRQDDELVRQLMIGMAL
jgi:hypothetical protein